MRYCDCVPLTIQRMMAAEIKRKQEEAHQKRRLQQLEEERKMASELAIKRREKDVSLFLI